MLHVLRYNIESFSNTIIQKPLMAARGRPDGETSQGCLQLLRIVHTYIPSSCLVIINRYVVTYSKTNNPKSNKATKHF